MKRGMRIFVFAALAAVLTWTAAEGASSMKRTVELTAGAASTVDLGKAVADILVANPAVADVGTLRSNRLYIVGRAVGDTNVLAFDDQGNQLADIAVRVSVDEATIRSTMLKFFPGEKIDVRTVRNDIVLSGTVSNPSVANQVRDLASRFVGAQGQTVVDLMKVAGEQQVMLKVKVIEAKRGALREYGFTPDYKAGSTTTPLSFNGIGGIGLKNATTPFGSAIIGINEVGNDILSFELRALERDGLISTLAEPNLTAISGETAGFLAGGEFPVPTGRDQDGNITIEFKQFGVSLNFTPTVMSKERISLQLSTEVSTQTDDGAVTLVNLRVPGLSVRRAQTTVQMGSGGTLMIAGLLRSEDIHSLNGLPGVQDVPVLGELFKSKSFSRDESELVIMVTPYLVEPFAEAAAVRVHDDAPVHSRPAPAPGAIPALPVAPASAEPLDAPMPSRSGALKEEEKSAPVPAQPAGKGARKDNKDSTVLASASGAPLSQTFIDNLRKVYGSRAPEKVAGGRSFGYIVD